MMFDKFKKNVGTTIVKWISLSSPNIVYGNASSYVSSRANTFLSEEQFKNISTVYVCAKILANTLARLPLNVYVEKDKFRYIDSTDYRHYLLHYQPNDYLDSFHFFNYLELQRNISGNSFARIYRKPTGDVISLELLPNNRVLDYDKINNQVYYKIKSEGGKEEILHSNYILHFRDITYDGIWGISPIEILRSNASLAYKALTSTDKAYDNDLRATLIIKPRADAGVITKEKYLELVEEVKKTNVGYEKTGSLIVLPSNMEAQPLEMNINDALFLASVKFSDGKIASFYGVPPNPVIGPGRKQQFLPNID